MKKELKQKRKCLQNCKTVLTTNQKVQRVYLLSRPLIILRVVFLGRYGVVPTGEQNIAPQKPANSQQTAEKQAVYLYSFNCVL